MSDENKVAALRWGWALVRKGVFDRLGGFWVWCRLAVGALTVACVVIEANA